MNSNILYKDSIPSTTNQIQNITTLNNPFINNPNYNNIYQNTPNRTILYPEQKVKSSYNSSTMNVGTINKTNSIPRIRQSNTMTKSIIERNILRISSSGTLISSKRSKRFNKVLKNGKKIRNIDVNDDYEEHQNEDLDSASTNSIGKTKSFTSQNKFTSLSDDIYNKKVNTVYQNPQFNGYPLTNNVATIKPKRTIESLNPFARFVNKILDMINPNINKNYYDIQPEQTIPNIDIPEKSSAYSKITPNTPNKFSQNTISTNETNNELINKKTNNNINVANNIVNNPIENKNVYNNIQKISVIPVNKVPTDTIKNIPLDSNSNSNSNTNTNKIVNINKQNVINNNQINKNIINENQSEKTSKNKENLSNNFSTSNKRKDDDKLSKSESKSSINKFPFQDLSNINSPTSKLSSNTNKNPFNNATDNYLITHLGEYMQKETQSKQLTVNDLLNKNVDKGFKFCGELTQAGTDANGNVKTDQDTSLISISIGGFIGFNLFGILDGHGPNGHFVSKYCKEFFINNMRNYAELLKVTKGITTTEGIYNELKNNRFLYITELFMQADRELAAQNLFDCYTSGTTCNIVFQFNKHLACFSVGDSRGILVYDEGNLSNLGILPLSTDHKPDLPGELERIQLCGGEVETMKDCFGNRLGPPRVYKAGYTAPGLAMSRSLGDFQAKECGVISTPQVIEYDINITSKYLVVCSDGVWEFISNEQVRDIGNIFYPRNDVYGFCSELINYSTSIWSQINIARDDITVVGVFF